VTTERLKKLANAKSNNEISKLWRHDPVTIMQSDVQKGNLWKEAASLQPTSAS